jgi:hypothetical protein
MFQRPATRGEARPSLRPGLDLDVGVRVPRVNVFMPPIARKRNDMPMNFTKLLQNLRSLGLAAALIAVATQAQAQAGRGPFAIFPGSWSGGGALSLASGAVERLHCTAAYRLDDGGATLMQNLDCASDSYKFDLTNQFQATGSDIAGQWLEVTRHAQGTIAGRVNGGHVEGTVTGPGFTATFSLQARANQQQVLIRVQGGDITQISAALVRGR